MLISLMVVFFFLVIIGTPVGIVFGLTAFFGFFKLGDPSLWGVVSQQFFSAVDNYALVAMPLFFLAGELMTKIALTERLVDFANLFFGRFRGGLAHVSIVSSVIFGGISGAAVADLAALGSIFIPSMTKAGYGKDFATALIMSASVIDPLIPPSIIFVVYGATMGVSIAGLFAAGIIPGLMVAFVLMALTKFISDKRGYPKSDEKLTFHRFTANTKRAALALLMPFIILGGILGGVVTPTEAAAIAVAYALFLGFFIYRNISFRDLYRIFFDTSVVMGIVSLILSSAAIIGWLLAAENVPEMVAQGFLSISTNKYVVLLMVNLFLILVGMLMDIMAALLILAPIIAPMVISLGVDPLHFGVTMCINLTLGLVTPPVGGCLFVAMAMTGLSMMQIIKQAWPFILAEIGLLFLFVYIPPLTMFLPQLLGFAK